MQLAQHRRDAVTLLAVVADTPNGLVVHLQVRSAVRDALTHEWGVSWQDLDSMALPYETQFTLCIWCCIMSLLMVRGNNPLIRLIKRQLGSLHVKALGCQV